MSVATKRRRRYTREFKEAVVLRFESALDVQELAAELGLSRSMLYRWHRSCSGRMSSGLPQPDAALAELPPAGPSLLEDVPAAAQRRISALERKIAQQQMALDFFRAALRHFEDRPLTSAGAFAKGSTR